MSDEIEEMNHVEEAISSDSAEYEVIELEYSEDEIEYYIEDEDGVELGFALKDEQGRIVEYYYDDEDAEYEEVGFVQVDASGNAVAASMTDDLGESGKQQATSNDAAEMGASEASGSTKGASKGSQGNDSLAFKAGSAAVKLRSKAQKAPGKVSEVAKNAKSPISKNELKEAATDLNDIYRTTKEVGGELKTMYDDITGMFDFLPKSKLKKFGKR